MSGYVVAIALLLVVGYAILDLWRHGERWLAIAVSLAAWVVLLIVVTGRLAVR